MVNWKSKKLGDLLWFVNGVVVAIIVNLVASNYFFRVDLTEEKRYTIKPQTKELLTSLEEDVYVEVFLEGDLNAGFRRFRKNIQETLEEFRIYSGNKVKVSFTDPAAAAGQNARNEFMQDLANRGIQPTNVVDTKNGERVEKLIFPGALVSYGGFETGVMLLKGNKAATSEEVINQSVEGVEFEIANAIYKLSNLERKRVGLVRGHGELDSVRIASLVNELSELYDVSTVNLKQGSSVEKYDVLIVAKPTSPYSEIEKLRLDQFVMKGGRAMFFIDKLEASMDSATLPISFAFPYRTELDDLLFRYGARINLDLVQDQHSGLYPVITGQVGGKPQVQMLNWPFFPLINNYPDHPITRNLDAVLTRFVSSIDTVKAPGIRKTPILYTSPYGRVLGAPVNISVTQLRELKPDDFSTPNVPVAYLLEGSFNSLYKNRFLPEGADAKSFVADGKPSKILVVADGDVLKNDINPRTRQPQALGFDAYTNYTFANRDFILNALAYLTEEDGLIQARSKQIRIRPLDKDKVRSARMTLQIINLVAPILLLIAYGILRAVLRKRKFANFPS